MTNTVLTKEFTAPAVNKREILHYMGVKSEDKEIIKLIDSCLDEVLPVLRYSVCWIMSDISIQSDCVEVAYMKINSTSLVKHFKNCDKSIIFSSTIGIGIDRFISRYSRISPVRALCIQAIGAERIESLCDTFCKTIKEQYGKTTARFSPGYGDLNINIQKDIFGVLNSAKNIGLTLNNSMIMSPSKSVTAFVGIVREEL